MCSDQQRWDTVARLGNLHIKTPALDALAAQGCAFRRAYTQSPICTPARASMLTGRYPASHCVYRNGNVGFPAHEKLVTRTIADAGYDCGLIGKLHLSAAKHYEVRPDDGYRVFHWSHHARPDFARGHDYECWLLAEKKVDPESVEQLPTRLRATGQSIGSAGGKFGIFLGVLIFSPGVIHAMGWLCYFLLVGSIFLALAVFVVTFGTETKGTTLPA